MMQPLLSATVSPCSLAKLLKALSWIGAKTTELIIGMAIYCTLPVCCSLSRCRYTDTNDDPYNAKRGFFYSHIGWLLVKRDRYKVVKSNITDLQRFEETAELS